VLHRVFIWEPIVVLLRRQVLGQVHGVHWVLAWDQGFHSAYDWFLRLRQVLPPIDQLEPTLFRRTNLRLLLRIHIAWWLWLEEKERWPFERVLWPWCLQFHFGHWELLSVLRRLPAVTRLRVLIPIEEVDCTLPGVKQVGSLETMEQGQVLLCDWLCLG